MEKSVRIDVKNGYEPQTVEVSKGVTTKLVFNRANPSACLEQVQSTDLNFAQDLPLGEDVAIAITPEHAGEYEYSCGMGMFHGKVVVK
ncbi:cupredoxin domain-containing protein [Limosilactobacillus sp.]|uniref:cupredoxin domain-containing protein n=1 Tax=Limosilactobacillus sp. TaxID=2773925 RepID=UPI003F01938C